MDADWPYPRHTVHVGTPARPPWIESDGKRHRYEHRRTAGEWLPTPTAGRTISNAAKKRANTTSGQTHIHVQIVPGPERTYQIVRVELATPVARGFRTKEGARRWLARAVKSGVLPQNVMEVEPPND